MSTCAIGASMMAEKLDSTRVLSSVVAAWGLSVVTDIWRSGAAR